MTHATTTRRPHAILARALAVLRGRGSGPHASVVWPGARVRSLRDDPRAPAAVAPPGSDWAWRPPAFDAPLPTAGQVGPASGLQVGPGVRLHHDCPLREIVLCPVAAPDRTAGLAVDVLHFHGSYLSFTLSLPADIARSLTRQHILTVQGQMGLSTPAEVFLRLNLRQGPDVASIARQVGAGHGDLRLDFDLACLDVHPDRITGAWVDLIVDRPEMTRCEVRDIVLSRRLRAML